MLTKFWDNLTTEDVTKLSRDIILIAPFSSIEQHGSHLPLNTDRVILDKILQKFCENNKKNKDFIILPNLSIGSASEHLDFEGTLSIDSINYINFCINYFDSILSKKFKKLLLINSHGGQTNHIEVIAKELKKKYNSINIIKTNYFQFEGYEKIISKNELEFGYHGGEFETSLMLYLAKDYVKINKIKKNKLSPDYQSKNIIGFEKNIKKQWTTKEISKNGIIGNPLLANFKKGEKLTNIALKTLKKIIEEFKSH